MLFVNINCCFAAKEDEDELNIKELVNNEEGSLFDKTIAKTIGGIAQVVYNIATGELLNVGFKNYDSMIFFSKTDIEPFAQEEWSLTMKWYKVFAYLSGSLIIIAVVIISYKMIASAISPAKRNEAKESLANLAFGAVAIAVAPTFIKFLLFLNNSLVNVLVRTAYGGRVNNLIDNEFLSSITTGNCIATALVISMFIYIFVKLNIKFIVRKFTLIVFSIFTPLAIGMWMINKNTSAAIIWFGQIMVNVFMQFIYCFLFLLFSSFLPIMGGWAVTLIWAMMILPVADVLMNCLQSLTSRIAGVNNNEITMKSMGMFGGLGGAIGYTFGAINTQFTNSNENSNNGNSGFVGKFKNMISPKMNLSNETDYNGNINPIRNVEPNNVRNISNIVNTNNSPNTNHSKQNIENQSTLKKVAKGTAKVTKGYLKFGANMTEGDFDNNSNKYSSDMKNDYNVTAENINQKPPSESSDDNEEI